MSRSWAAWFLLVLTLAIGMATGQNQAQAQPQVQERQSDLKDLVRTAGDSVVLLRLYDHAGRAVGSGTGFYVGPGLLATNHHVINRATRVGAVLRDGSEVPVEAVLAEDPVHDLALLAAPPGPLPLPLYRGRVEAGEAVAVIGSPQGLSGTLSTGIVSAVRERGLENGELPGPLLQISAPISQGSSGSPVMNLRGEVIGVAVAVYVTGQNLNFAVPTSKLLELEKAIDPTGLPLRLLGSEAAAKRQVALGRNLLISVAIFAVLIVVLRRLR